MKKIFVCVCVVLFMPALSFGKIELKKNKAKIEKTKKQVLEALKKETQKTTSAKQASQRQVSTLKTEKVIPPKIIPAQNPSALYPLSSAARPLVLPQGLKDGNAFLAYHYFSSGHLGANLNIKGRYSYFKDWEFIGESGIFPQTQKGFEFGGIRTGFLYKALEENEDNPELALGFKIGLWGKGAYSLTKNNTFAAFPHVAIKKEVTPGLSLQGEFMPGVGSREAGLASLNVGGILKTTQDIDLRLKIDLQNLGYSFEEIMSLTPAIEYHFKKDIDILGGAHIGFLGAEQLGNNFFIGMSSRF